MYNYITNIAHIACKKKYLVHKGPILDNQMKVW